MEYFLTALAGAAIALVAMRLLQGSQAGAKPTASDEPAVEAAPPSDAAAANEASAETSGASLFARFGRTQIMFGAAGALLLASILIFFFRGEQDAVASNGLTSGSSMAATGAPAQNLDDVGTMIGKLAERLKTDTNDGEGFRMLGWSYVNTGRAAEAVPAYKRATELLPGRADVHAGYGEALVAAANDRVTPEAKAAFDRAIALDAKEPRARFFLSLFKSQNGDEKTALDEWIALANEMDANLPWQADLRQRAQKLADKLGINIAGRLKAATAAAQPASGGAPFMASGPDAAAVAAAEKLPADQRNAMIDGMVEGLATKLRSNPDNVDGWIKLIRSRMVLKQAQKAKVDLSTARKVFAGQPDKLGAINSLAQELDI